MEINLHYYITTAISEIKIWMIPKKSITLQQTIISEKQQTMKHSLLMLLALWGCTTQTIWAEKQIYVSPKGNDQAEGTLSHPLKTIRAALDKANTLHNEDVKIFLRKGCY